MINQPEQGTEWFDVLHAQREAIEHDFGGPLMWDPLPEQKRSLIRTVVPGGWHLAEAEWQAFQDALIQLANRMDSVLRGRIRDIEEGCWTRLCCLEGKICSQMRWAAGRG